MKSILVVHPQFDGIGGAEQVAIRLMDWIAQKLGQEILLLTLFPVRREILIRSGLSESTAEKIRLRAINPPFFLRSSVDKLHLLKLAILHRKAREISVDHDICISTYNELDFGKKSIQYIHHPSFADPSILKALNLLGREIVLARLPFVNHVYRRLVSVISRDSLDGYRKNLTLVNSGFMKKVVKEVYGIDGEVVYPAFLPDDRPQYGDDWGQRETRFVSVARIAPDKNLTTLIDYFSLLHKEFPEYEYVIAGWSSDPEYGNLLVRTAKGKGLSLRILKNLPDKELKSLLTSSKFYVHSKINEHFGISIIQAAASGCLTLVHNSGSAEEIIRTPRLLFENGNDLVSKVKDLLDDSIRRNVLDEIRLRLKEFTLKGFYSKLDEVVLPKIGEMGR